MRSLCAAACLVAIVFPVFGQTDRGTITGTITDPAGAVVANAAVEAKNVGTGAVYSAASSGTGNYTIAQLPVGSYDLTVTVMGFKKFVRTGLVVEVAGTLRVDPKLEVGASTESITVTEAAPLLKTEGGEVSYNIATTSLDDLPILTLSGAPYGFGNTSGLGNIRNPLASVDLLPGTHFSTDNTMRINGMPSSSQTINVEGQDASNGLWKQITQINQAGADAIQEVAIQTSNFAAEYGQAGGGYFNYTMKSGTNQLHGSAYDYFVNEALNAGLPFTDAGTVSANKAGQHIRNALRQNDYGFTFGGPIVIPKVYNGHDRTFFFFNFEQFRQSNVNTNTIAIVPTAAERQGNFAADEAAFLGCHGPDPAGTLICPNQIFDPATRRLVNGAVVADPFPGNAIPANRMDPTALIIQGMFPQPNTPGLFNYTAPAYSDFRHTSIPSLKIDQVVSARMKIAGYYSATYTSSPQTNGFPQPFSTLIPQTSLAQTVRINLDETLTPTLLLHFGAGLLHTSNPQVGPFYDQAANNLFPQGAPFPGKNFPYLSGLDASSFLPAGFSGGGGFPTSNTGSFFEAPGQYDIKPTFNASATWVKGNHTFKLGASALFEGLPTLTTSRAQGEFEFSQIETANPWQLGQPFQNTAGSGFGYASFLLGAADGLQVGVPADSRLGMHSFALYLQDSWKVNRKLTLDLGLRWDYASLWHEQYGRMQNAAFGLPNTLLGGRLGTVQYEATCHCTFAPGYPYSIGPHLGVAYQITPKTVFRAGGAISYAAAADNAGLNVSVPDFLTLGTPAYGLPAAILKAGDPYAPGNVYGNPVLTWPNTFLNGPNFPAATASGVIPPGSPFISISPNSARLPRTFQWSIGFQRELTRNLVVEAAYVGNRGDWWTAPLLSGLNYNALTPQQLTSQYGLNVANPADAALLNTPISSPAVIQRFPYLANPNSVYPGFPSAEPLIAALVPYPQWFGGIPPFLGPPLGKTWYDSLQIKATKRFSHGLTANVAYTWEKELTNGVNSNTSYLTPDAPLINDVFNLGLAKQLSGFDLPQTLTIAFNYTTPKFSADSKALKALSWLVRDWSYSGLLRYQSGVLIRTPPSNNNLLANLGRGPANNPALWGGGTTFYNRVPGQPLFLVDPNSHFDPTTQLVLNPNAWVDAAPGQFGASAPYYNDFRWQRQPAESMGFGRIFPFGKEGRFRLQIRAEFQNVFNRLVYSLPADAVGIFGLPSTNPATPTARGNSFAGAGGLLSGGFGYVNWVNGAGATPRSGQIVARFQF
ncbi:MAG: TonB-dependent receptor [Bryobacterales bacterium]|nr:TonB-dependent receptor [Bryobacterales bacterium]